MAISGNLLDRSCPVCHAVLHEECESNTGFIRDEPHRERWDARYRTLARKHPLNQSPRHGPSEKARPENRMRETLIAFASHCRVGCERAWIRVLHESAVNEFCVRETQTIGQSHSASKSLGSRQSSVSAFSLRSRSRRCFDGKLPFVPCSHAAIHALHAGKSIFGQHTCCDA